MSKNSWICLLYQKFMGSFWDETHPPSKFRGNLLSSFYVLVTHQPTNKWTNWQSWKHSHLLGRGKKLKCFWLKTNKTKLRVKGYFQIVCSVMNMFLFHTESDTFSWNRTFNCESTEKTIKDQRSTDQNCQTCLTVFIQQAELTQVSQRPTLERDLI